MHSIRECVLLLHVVLVFAVDAKAVDSVSCNYTVGDIVGIIIGSVIITLVVVALSLLFLWYLWRNNHLKLAILLRRQKKGKVETNVIVNRNDVESGHDFAFDNPYFKDDENEVSNANARHSPPNQVNKEIEKRSNANCEQRSGDTLLKECDYKNNGFEKVTEDKKRLIKSLPLANVFNHVSKHKQTQKTAAVDDTCINSKPQQVVVELTGHDFTGLGFNICGNMRDGIFVKDVMNRGPAHESGKVKAGDRIASVTISCKNMVYEDALTILSYASPYNIQLLLEKCSAKESNCLNLGLTRKTYLSSNSILGSGRRLLHPLYRSQSLEDLTQIGHTVSEKSFAAGSNSPQNVLQKLKSQLINRSAKSDSSEKDKTSFSSDPKFTSVSSFANNSMAAKDDLSTSVSTAVDPVKPVTLSTTPVVSNVPLETSAHKCSASDVNDFVVNVNADISDVNLELKTEKSNESDEQVLEYRPLPAPRKPASAAKRKGKAPLPPFMSTPTVTGNVSPVNQDSHDVPDGQMCKSTVETTAQVHQADEASSCTIVEENDCYANNNDKSDLTIKENSCEERPLLNGLKTEESETNSVVQQSPPRVQNNEKLKSSSLGDLTLAHKTNGNVLQSVILERAVSLDFKEQHFPEENLCHHFKNIRVPSDVDYKNSENIAFSKWEMKKRDTSSIFTTSSSDCMGSNAIISINGRLTNSECDDSLICIDISKDNFIASTPLNKNERLCDSFAPDDNIIEKFNYDLSEGEIDEKGVLNDDTLKKEEIKINSDENETTNTGIENTEEAAEAEKAVIEINKNELDNVLMSYQQYTSFLEKQSQKVNRINSTPLVNSVHVNTNSGIAEMAANQLDFESWSYISDQENSIIHDSSHYRTALEGDDFSSDKHVPEISGVTLKSS